MSSNPTNVAPLANGLLINVGPNPFVNPFRPCWAQTWRNAERVEV